MPLSLKRIVIAVVALTFLVTGSMFAPAMAASPSPPKEDHFSIYVSEKAAMLLGQIQREAADLSPHADNLYALGRSPIYNWRTHADYLNRVKTHINTVGGHLEELQRIRERLAPWQQQAITDITSHAAQIAASTEAAIVHLRGNRDRLFVPEYREHLTRIADRAEAMKQTVNKFLDYEEMQEKLNQLKRELEIRNT